jgi:hypothetical protein
MRKNPTGLAHFMDRARLCIFGSLSLCWQSFGLDRTSCAIIIAVFRFSTAAESNFRPVIRNTAFLLPPPVGWMAAGATPGA